MRYASSYMVVWLTLTNRQPIPTKTSADRSQQDNWESTVSEFHKMFRSASPETATSKKHAQYFLNMRLARYLANPVYFKFGAPLPH